MALSHFWLNLFQIDGTQLHKVSNCNIYVILEQTKWFQNYQILNTYSCFCSNKNILDLSLYEWKMEEKMSENWNWSWQSIEKNYWRVRRTNRRRIQRLKDVTDINHLVGSCKKEENLKIKVFALSWWYLIS